jgi:hypothetical protein
VIGAAITLAWPASGNATLAKRIKVRDGIIVNKAPAPNVARFRFEEVPASDLISLATALDRGAASGAIAVRGKPKMAIGRRAIYDSPEKGPAGLEVVPRPWVGVDWDVLPLEWRHYPGSKFLVEDHPLHDPELGALAALRRLPPPFRTTSCCWQLTSSAGLEPGFRLRTWHWLSKPCTGAELKIWFAPAIKRGMIDPATLVEAQPHYLAVAVEGGDDPAPQRFGLLHLARDTVPVPDLDAMRKRQEEAAQAERPPSICNATPSTSCYAEQRIDECVVAVRLATARHPTYLQEAARAKAICDRHGLDWKVVKARLIQAYESTLAPRKSDNESVTPR